jgi:uncharacterized protein with FMN-binding domain
MVMWAKTKKIVLSLSFIVLFALYAVQKQAQPNAPLAASVANAPISAPTTVPSQAQVIPTSIFDPGQPASTSVPNQNDFTPTPSAGGLRDGSYTGDSADAHWGSVQVVAVISGGKLSDVQFLVYPNHRNRSQEINNQAMPMLTQEAIQAQNANVDIVSGATDTSEAFVQSLSSALDQAAR